MHQVLLGSEADDALFERLCVAVKSLHGTISDSQWVLGGPQELTKYKIVLPAGIIEAVAKTDAGLSLRGARELFLEISSRVLSK